MKRKHYSEKLSQLKLLRKKLNKIYAEDKNLISYQAKSLIFKIKALVKQLSMTVSKRQIRRVMGAFAIVLGTAYQGQSQYVFTPGVLNPFGITNEAADYNFICMADFDDDGDLDILSGSYVADEYDPNYGAAFVYYENLGTPQLAQFADPVINPFNLDGIGYINTPTSADIDGDGDVDLLIGGYIYAGGEGYLSGAAYYENIGTPENPNFAELVIGAFNIQAENEAVFVPTWVDIDGDGDLDIISSTYDYDTDGEPALLFHENVGSATAPNYAAPEFNTFGLDEPGIFNSFGDLDGDGDLDLMSNLYNLDGENLIKYYENTGSTTAPSFQNTADIIPNTIAGFGELSSYGSHALADLDDDGDLDFMFATYTYGKGYANTAFIYYENDAALSVEETFTTNVQVFPNPASDIINIPVNYSELIISDVQGKKVEAAEMSTGALNVSHLESGLYFISLIDDSGEYKNLRFLKE